MDMRKLIPFIFIIVLVLLIGIYTYETIITFGPINGYIGDEVWYASSAYNILKLIFHINIPMQFPYPNEQNIQTYINPEHPPLAKYIIGIFILFLGYKPSVWRIPSWIIGDLTIIVAFLFGKKMFKGIEGYVAGLLASILVILDPNFWVLHGIALLDVYVGFFSLLSLYFLLTDRPLYAAIALGLAMASKESAYPLFLPFLYYIGEIRKSPITRLYYSIIIPALTYIALSIPLIIYYGGIFAWLHNTILHTASWDITNGHISLTATSQISTPWDWLLDINPFYLGYNLYARVNIALMWLWILLTPFAFYLKNTRYITMSMWAWTMWLAFVLVYFLGNHTLFSFYVTDFSPVVDVYDAIAIVELSNFVEPFIVKIGKLRTYNKK